MHVSTLVYIYILDARWGALKRPPSRASFRRTVVPSYRRFDGPKVRCAEIPPLRPNRRSKSELKPKTSEELKSKTPKLQSKSSGLKPKPKGQDLTAKAQDPELKPKTAKLK